MLFLRDRRTEDSMNAAVNSKMGPVMSETKGSESNLISELFKPGKSSGDK